MTREQTKRNIDEICAFSNGKDIQRKYKLEAASKWEDDHDPSWNDRWYWRIKPEAVEVWIIWSGVWPGGDQCFFTDKSEAQEYVLQVPGRTIKHMKEVL